jgi:uncharacterized protein involved in type VI secretion and phage assembly
MDPSAPTKYYGKYRASVINNIDPMQQGRIMVMVPDVHASTPSTWAMPCVPISGMQSGFFSVPPIGAGVWVEFEQGDADYPVWVGGYWGGAEELPVLAKTVPPGTFGIAMQTTLQNGLVISDLPGPTGGIMLKSATGATLIVNDTGIYIQNGKGASIVMVGPSVAINQTALVVT